MIILTHKYIDSPMRTRCLTMQTHWLTIQTHWFTHTLTHQKTLKTDTLTHQTQWLTVQTHWLTIQTHWLTDTLTHQTHWLSADTTTHHVDTLTHQTHWLTRHTDLPDTLSLSIRFVVTLHIPSHTSRELRHPDCCQSRRRHRETPDRDQHSVRAAADRRRTQTVMTWAQTLVTWPQTMTWT